MEEKVPSSSKTVTSINGGLDSTVAESPMYNGISATLWQDRSALTLGAIERKPLIDENLRRIP